MRFLPSVSAVAAIAVLTATTLHGATPSADAHASGGIVIQGHHFKTPPPPTPKATPVDNVRDFGAVGNGIIDDTNAIQNAANDAANRHIGLFFPPGTYLHANAVVFNGISVTGSGNASQLVSNNPNNCAVILTGFGPSIQNIVISTNGLTGFTSVATANTATLLITSATSFTAANLTIVSGTNIWGALVLQSTVGSINSSVFDGTGHVNDEGVVIAQGDNVSVTNSLFQNESIGVDIQIPPPPGGPSQFIAVLGNTLGNVTFPITQFGVRAIGVNVLAVSQNTMQMLNSTGTLPVILSNCNDFAVIGNNTFGGAAAVQTIGSGPGNNLIVQNTIHNCGQVGIFVSNAANSAVQITSNTFGECGIAGIGAVIDIQGGGGNTTTFVQNNSYQGHTNLLMFYVFSNLVPHIPAANVTGNTQTQTTLSNSI